jgi:NADH:ubiquinone oxidoreductase subunit 6 (subunit J)
MNQGTLFLYLFTIATFISVVIMLFTRTIFYAALALITCLISIAGIYALLYAEFIAITQIVIYAGGVIVLILFGIMLTNRIADKPLSVESHHRVAGVVVSLGIFVVLIFAYVNTRVTIAEDLPPPANHINQIGIQLMSTYVAPFEIAGVLLLLCLVGASLMASSFKKNDHV